MSAINIFSDNVLAQDHVGFLSVDPEIGMVYYRHADCGGSAKGSGDGIVCRGCYYPMSDEMGRAWMVQDEESWAAYADRLRPELVEFADKMARRVRDRARKLAGLE